MQVFLKQNVRYLVWTCWDPIFSDSRDLMIIFCDPGVPEAPYKNPDICDMFLFVTVSFT